MRRLILLLPLAIAAPACTPVQWARQDTTPEQFGQDHAYCRQEAWREAQTRSLLFMNRSVGATTIVDPQGRTVVVPSSPFGDPFGDAYIEESRLTAVCMRARGYELVPAKPAS
ncbi:MAG TPA: hypothetical protein VGF58_19500 [Burkholderiales bacterium]|jgi:hypothetical protein